MSEQAVADACFLIDWCRYAHWQLLEHLFQRIYIHAEVLDQLVSEPAVKLASTWLGKRFLVLYPWMEEDEQLAQQLTREIVAHPQLPYLERPDVLCLVIALRTGAPLLSENTGILRACNYHPRLTQVQVLTALDVLTLLAERGHLPIASTQDFLNHVRAYSEQTGHVFSEARIKQAVARIERWLQSQ